MSGTGSTHRDRCVKLVGYLCVTATLAWLLLVYTPKAASDDNPPVTTTTVVTVPETYQGKGVRWWARHAVRARRDANLRKLVIVRLRARLARYVHPSRRLASVGGVPAWFWQQAMCIHSHEAHNSWFETSNPTYRGGLQFSYSTWARAGGSGDPARASESEQVYRAYLIWRQDGGSWREWSTAGMCGLR